MMRLLLSVLVVSLVGIFMIPNAFAENVPDWVKNTAGWWASDQITDSAFLQGIQYLIKEGIMVIPPTEVSESVPSQEVPSWVKNNAGWWADDQINDSTFVSGIQYLIKSGIIVVTQAEKSVAEVGPIIYDDDYIVEKFVTGLENPTTMTFVGDDILVLEKNTGKVIRIQDNGVIYNEPVLDVPVIFQHEAGLLGTTSTSNHIYLYFTESPTGFDKFNHENARNVVYQYDWNGEKLTNPILIKVLPGHLSITHHGGVITTGLNNEIYFVIGDQDQYTAFQNIPEYRIVAPTAYETGSIFKIDTESNNSVELFATGIRNSFGLAVDPVTGYLWDTENGSDKFDEINLVKPKFNSGWRLAMGPVVDSSIISQPFENFVYSNPEFSWYRIVAPTAIAFPDKDSFRKYSDWLFVGDFHHQKIYKFQLNADRTGFVFSNPELSDLVLDDNDKIDEILFAENFPGGITDIEFHDDVMYVVCISDGSIYKIYLKEHLKKIEKIKFEMLKLLKTRTGIEYINLSNSDLSGSNFYTAKISNVNFTQTNLSHANLSNKDLTGTILTGANLSNSILTGVNLSGKDLTGTTLAGADLTDAILTGVDLSGKDLTGAKLAGVDLSGKDLTGAKLAGVDLSGNDLTGTILTKANLSNSILTGVDLSGKDLTGTTLAGADLSEAILTNADLSDMDLSFTNLTGQDLSGHDIANTIFTGANLIDVILPGGVLSGKNFESTKFNGVDLSGEDLSYSKFLYATFDNANMENTNLTEADFVQVDFTKIKNKSLAGANLSDASFTYSNLSGVNLAGVILDATNFWKADLSGVDFTVTDVITDGLTFIEANLSNSNFEGVDLSPKEQYFHVFENKAHLKNLQHNLIVKNLFGDFANIRVLSAEVRGNDLAVTFVFFNNFTLANLENTNFKNAKLWSADFYSANLTNADLSGADLSKAFLSGADLSNANLEGANLSNAIWDENTILKCINHPICNS